MRVAVNLVKSGAAHACVSAGNTGALMATSRYVLKTLPGIDRPAIATVLPNMRGGWTYVLDLGANVDCTPEQLMQFGVMGAMLVAAVEHKERPTVGLLNIGVEDIKGNETVKRAGRAAARQRAQFPRQRGRRRHLQGNHRRGGVRRLRRQLGAEGLRGRRQHDRRRSCGRSSRAIRLRKLAALVAMPVLKRHAPAHGSGPLQRREPARPARRGDQEPWLGGRVRVRQGAGTRGGRKCATT